MKNKVLCLIIMAILFIGLPTLASDIEVQPTMISKSNAQDRVWAGTFQIVWNEFIDKYVHNPVRLKDGTPFYVYELNRRTFDVSNIAEACYYKFSGNVKKNTVKNIKKAIKKKFNETSDILDILNPVPGPDSFLIYAMLKKDFEFIKEFDKLGASSFGTDMTADYFGVNKKTDNDVRTNIKVLFYNNPKDFAVVLSTKNNDEVYLYKNSANKNFQALYLDMNLKTTMYKGEKTFSDSDEFKVPNIKFDVNKSFDELSGKRVLGSNIIINKALESIQFNMDSKGVQLKSEAAMTFVESIGPGVDKPKPRLFYFDDTFVIFLKEQNKKFPYFALRVHDITKFQ